VMLLAVAIWLISHIIPGPVNLILWAVLSAGSALMMGALSPLANGKGWRKLWKALGLVLLLYSGILVVGAAMGNTDFLRPLSSQTQHTDQFKTIKTVQDVQSAIAEAKGKPVLLDFYADWCISCKDIERLFNSKAAQTLMRNFVLLRADITANDTEDQALLQHYGVIAPPTVLLFDTQGKEHNELRLIGEFDVTLFARQINKIR